MKVPIGRRQLVFAGAGGLAAVALVPALAAPGGKFEVQHSPAEWRKRLGAQRYAVLREGATERAYSSPLNEEHRAGTFVCAGCGLPLFSSRTKFESGTGWPSYFKPLAKAVITRPDNKFMMKRTEVLCRRCGGHLGHVFNDGPRPTRLRYCMNGLSLKFVPA